MTAAVGAVAAVVAAAGEYGEETAVVAAAAAAAAASADWARMAKATGKEMSFDDGPSGSNQGGPLEGPPCMRADRGCRYLF